MSRKQVVVIGLGRFGSSLARMLFQMGHDVLAIDNDDTRVQEVMGQVTYPVRANATSEATLRELGIANFDVGVVAIGSNIQASIVCTVLLKSLGVPHVVARAHDPVHGQALQQLGANRVIYPEQEMGTRAARNLFDPDVLEYMEVGGNFGVSKLQLPRQFNNLTLKEASLTARDRYHITVLAIRRGNDVHLLPSEEERLRVGDVLVIAAQDGALERFRSVD